MNPREIEQEINNINDSLEDEIENLKYLLNFVEIEYINLLSVHYKIKTLLNQRDYLTQQLFNLNEY